MADQPKGNRAFRRRKAAFERSAEYRKIVDARNRAEAKKSEAQHKAMLEKATKKK